MTTTHHEVIKHVLGVVGDVTSGALFLSPMPTFIRICKSKSTLEFHPYTYLSGVLNCFFWVFYSLPMVSRDNMPITVINSFGLFLYLCYLGIFVCYTDSKVPEKRRHRVIIIGGLLVEFLFAGLIAFLALHFFHSIEARTNFAGGVSVLFSIILYASPLSIMVKVMKTKSAEFLPFWIAMAGLSNGVVWSLYAFFPLSLYVLVPNGLGAFLSAVQLLLHAIYRDTTPKEKGKKQSEVQLQAISETA